MSFVRSSKYRHVFGSVSKEVYFGIKVTKSSADARFCSANPKFFAAVVQGAGGGPFLVLPLEKLGRIPTDQPFINGHTDAVMELAWSPFNDNLLASSSDDCTIMLWDVPDEGINETVTEPWRKLEGHEKKVMLLEWHPSAEYILASGSADNQVKIWNVETEECVHSIEHPDSPTCISWNVDGSLLATTCKDKNIRIIDPRKEEVLQETKLFEGGKSSKCVFLKDGKLFTVGFSKMSQRIYALLDSKNLKEPLTMEDIDSGSGVIHLHYDPDNNVIFTIGKGDSTVKFYEVTNEAPYVFFLNQFTASKNTRGFGWLPKRGLDYTTCEIARCYRLTEDKCEPTSMIVPRKSDLFQEDIYPPCSGYDPALTAEEWLSGKNAKPKKIEIKPMFEELRAKGAGEKKGNRPLRSLTQKPAKTLSAAPAQGGASLPDGVNLENLVDDVKKLKSTVRSVCRRLTNLEKKLGEVSAESLEE